MSGKMKIFGMCLVMGLLFACGAWAGDRIGAPVSTPDVVQVDSWHESGAAVKASAQESLDVAALEKGALHVAEAGPAENKPAPTVPAETVKPQETSPADMAPQGVKPEEEKPGDSKKEDVEAEETVEGGAISDPFEPVNRAMFVFNDKLYFWFFKPVAQAYNWVVPEPVRISIRNFFRNATMPIRFVNCLLQGKFESAGIELVRFGVNTTVGLVGFLDIAKDHFELQARNEDLGQTLGLWGMGGLMYIVWPFIGPSTVRDTIGMAGDSFLEPFGYINPVGIPVGIAAFDRFNKTSLELGTYEDLVESALDPYIAVRDAFIQHRNSMIKR